MTLNLTKVAAGCRDLDTLIARQRHWHGDDAAALTRFMPKRADELIGGSLYWIIAHRLVARQRILGLAMVETPWGTKCRIALQPQPVLVQPVACRAHQGWRYLAAADAPPDLADAPGGADTLPPELMAELTAAGIL